MSGWTAWLYIGACVVVPAAWGAISAWIFARRDRKREEAASEAPPPIDYMI